MRKIIKKWICRAVSGSKVKTTRPVIQAMTRHDALKDLAYLVNHIKRIHLSTTKGLPDAIQLQYKQEIANIPMEPTVLNVWNAASRILRKLKDAHSRANFHSMSQLQKRLDQNFIMINSRVICITGSYFGWRVNKVNNITIEELYARFLSLYSYENVYWAINHFPYYLRTIEGLNWLGIATNGSLQVEFENNSVKEIVTLPFIEPIPANNNITPREFVRYEIDTHRNVGIFILDKCMMNEKYEETIKKFFTEVKVAGIQNIAIDLRVNGGGNSDVIDKFLQYLPVEEFTDYGVLERLGRWIIGHRPLKTKNKIFSDLAFHGRAFVLTSSGTFSSAMLFAVILRDNDLCRVIGQPLGNKPSHYGESLDFQMPNSKLVFTLTYKKFTRPDTSKNDEEALIPDYPTILTVESDGVMEKLYEVVNV